MPNPESSIKPDTHNLLGKLKFAQGLHFDAPPRMKHFVHQDNNTMSGVRKRRDIYAPNEAMSQLHECFIDTLRSLEIALPYATGGLPGNSPRTNLERHADSRYFVLYDLKDAYAQVDMFVLAHVLVGYGLDEDVLLLQDFLETYCQASGLVLETDHLCPEQKGLCTGMPSSPLLFNIYCAPLDEKLGELSTRYGMVYSRYLDDLTFSSPEQPEANDNGRIGRGKRSKINGAIAAYGMEINPKKTKVLDRKVAPVRVNGLQLNTSGRWQATSEALADAAQLFRATLLQMRGHGLPLDELTWARLAGQYGAIAATFDTRRVRQTDQELEVIDLFKRLRTVQAAKKGRARRHGCRIISTLE